MRHICIGLSLVLLTGFQFAPAAAPKTAKAGVATATKLDDSPLALSDPAGTLAFDWSRLAAGGATISILNKSSGSVSVSASALVMSCDQSCRPLTVGVRPAKASIGSYEIVVFTLILPPDSQPGNYTGVFRLNDDSKKTAPFRQPVWVKPFVSKLAKTIYRNTPCGNCFSWQTAVPVPLAAPDGQNSPAGALVSDAGNILFAYWQQQASGLDLVFNSPPAAGKYQGEVPWGPPSAKTSLAITVIVSDLILWPLLVILLGTTLAYLVKRYLGVTRITLDLRRRDAELGELWHDNRRQFLTTAQHQPFSTYSINKDIDDKRSQIRAALKRIDRQWLRSSLDDKDADYQQALNNIAALQTAIAPWPDFAPALLKLAAALRNAQAIINGEDLIPVDPSPDLPSFARDAQQLLQGSEITVEEFAVRRAKVTDQTAVAINWIAAYKLVKNTTSRYRTIKSGNLTDEQKTLVAGIEPRLVTAWKRLFEVSKQADIDAIAAPGSDVDAAEVTVRELEDTLATPPAAEPIAAANFTLAVLAERVDRIADFSFETAGRQRTIDDHARARILRDRIRLDDTLSFLFAVLIAILTGLNTYYFAQPFGTLKDYVGLFLWAAGTKATLDILGAVFDKLAPLRTATGNATV